MLLGLRATHPGVPCCVLAGGAPWDWRGFTEEDDQMVFLMGRTRAQNSVIYDDACPWTSAVPGSVSGVSFFLYHGSSDPDIPCAHQMSALCNKLRQAGAANVEEWLIDGGTHLSAAIDHECKYQAMQFLSDALKLSA